MINPQTDLYAEYLKIKVKYTRHEKKSEREIEALKNELAQTHERYKKQIFKLRLEIVNLTKKQIDKNDYAMDAKSIIQKAADYSGFSYDDMMGKWRLREIAVTRHVVWYFMRYKMGMTLKEIARLFGKDHSSIIHGVRKVDDYLSNPKFYPQETQLYKFLNNE